MSEPYRILLPTDASPSAMRAAEHVVDLARRGLSLEVHLLNVQAPLRGTATLLIAHAEREAYHREEGMKALAGARQTLEQAGIPVHVHVGVGDAGETVLGFARQLNCQHIIMGTRGLGGFAGMIIGSVAHRVIAESNVPVTLLRARH